MDSINEINRKLKEIGHNEFSKLDSKEQKRFLEIERLILESTDLKLLSVKNIRKNKLTKSFLSNSIGTSFSRKTVHNNPLLDDYINLSIAEDVDYLNEKRIKLLIGKNNEIEEHNRMILRNIIDMSLIQRENIRLIEEIKKNRYQLDFLKGKLNSKEDEIDELKRKVIKSNNITKLDRVRED